MLTTTQLLSGYARGIFPMAESASDPRLYWFDPPRRGILPIGAVHASRSLQRELRRGPWTAHLDGDFSYVVDACAQRNETWINTDLRQLYCALHTEGRAAAIEIRYDGVFAGGLFGVMLQGAFFGESMVSARQNGSKMALLWLSTHLKHCGFTLFDTQFLTPHLASMGGIEVPRGTYQLRLKAALREPADIHARPLPDKDQLLQEITQIS